MKRKNIYLLGIFILIVSIMQAQQKVIDSLEQQLLNPTNGLSVIENLNEISWYYAHSNPNKGIEKANSAIELAISEVDSLQLGIAYERKGFNYQNQGKDSLTILMYDFAEEVYSRANYYKRFATIAFNKGNFYLFRSNYRKSLDEGQKALEIFKSNTDTLKMARAYNQIALNYLYLGDYTKSLNTLQKGSLLLEQSNKDETASYGEIQGNLGLLHEKLSDYETAMIYQNKALIIYKKNNYERAIANAYNNLGKLYGLLDEHQKALEMFDLSIRIKRKNGNKYRIANGFTNLGLTYSALNQHNKSLKYFDQAKSIYRELGHDTNLSTVYKNLGDLYLEKRRIQKATIQFDSALIHAKKAEDKRAIYLAKEGLGKAAFQNQNYKKAYKEQQDALIIKDSILSNDNRDELAELKAKYEYEKEKAILEANFEKKKTIDEAEIRQQTLIRNISIGASILGISILVIVLTLLRRKKEAELNAKIVTSELQKLRAQINPHFIFNSLNSINDFIQKNKKEDASNYLIQFSTMMRKILDNSKEEEVSLEEEIKFLENYIKLEQQRLKNTFEYSIKVDDEIDKENTLIPPSLLQPFIENSIWHGLSEKRDKDGRLTITITKNQNMLICAIDDNGVGIKPKEGTTANKKSFGTSGAQNRLNLSNKLNGTDAKIDFIEKEEGVQVVVQLPLSLEI